jgi:hypothetical protein
MGASGAWLKIFALRERMSPCRDPPDLDNLPLSGGGGKSERQNAAVERRAAISMAINLLGIPGSRGLAASRA